VGTPSVEAVELALQFRHQELLLPKVELPHPSCRDVAYCTEPEIQCLPHRMRYPLFAADMSSACLRRYSWTAITNSA
jgi:hypothetical protein